MDDRHARTAVITGAAQGLGRETARVLAAAGYRLVLIDLQSPDAALAELRAAGHDGLALKGDVADEAFVQHAVAATAEAFGATDVLVNNAGISLIVPAERLSAAQWRRVMDVNLLGPFLLCRDFGRAMLERGSGSIVNVASVAGLRGGHPSLLYPTSKGAVVNMTRAMAAHHGDEGIRVNCIAPGMVYTPMVWSRGMSPEMRDARRRRSLLQTEGTGWDVGHGVLYLVSDEARWVTGIVLPVDAGATAGSGRVAVPPSDGRPG
jgi:NAD(P)-dependent dehydrogenase (short-subunit alcohol dehydrogenase family)